MNHALPYTAGYIDGDGCFFLCKEKNPLKYAARIIISSTCKQVLSSFHEEFFGSLYLTPQRELHWKRTYQWMLRGNAALEFTYEILDFLTEKKGDALLFIEFVRTNCKLKKQELFEKMRCHREEIRQIDEEVVTELRKIQPRGVIDESDYAYLAGFIDAECCLGIGKYKPKNRPNPVYKISLQCTNTNPIIFFWLMERFGGTISHVKRNEKNPKHRDQIVWNLSAAKLAGLLPKILPYLRTKKLVCAKLIEFYNTDLPTKGSRKSQEFLDSYATALNARNKLVDDIHKLNSKGV